MTNPCSNTPRGALGDVFKRFALVSEPVESPKRQEKPSTYVTVRVTPEEKEKLLGDARNLSLSDYVRAKLLGDDVTPRKSRGKYIVKDKQSLALILRTIGGAQFSNRMHRLILAHEEDRLGLDQDLADELRAMAWDIATMRNALVKALGLKPLPSQGKMDHVTFEAAED